MKKIAALQRFLLQWPGRQYFGAYRFLPIYFVFGAGLEFAMIKWNPGEINFYKLYKKKEAKRYVQELTRESELSPDNIA